MEFKKLQQLISKYNAGKASSDERALLEEWYDQVHGTDLGYKEAQAEVLKREIRAGIDRALVEQPRDGEMPVSRTSWKIKTRWMQWAAVLTVTLGISVYMYQDTHREQITKNNRIKKYTNDIQPGSNKATLTLAGGSKIILNSLKDGSLITEGNTAISKTSDGQLVYNLSDTKGKSNTAELNIISTPLGGQYQVTLSDGTKVWLNSASSLKFPPTFQGNVRNVEITGEAYFEVAKNSKMPFLVKVGDTQIKVLGTHFNVMAYPDEKNQETTLLEGSVIVSRHSAADKGKDVNFRILSPGQQASIEANSNVIDVLPHIDTDYITAWKDGLFLFDNTNIEKVMNQVRRWYNAEIIYDGVKPEVKFTGVIPRSNNLSDLLGVLELAGGVNFNIKGNKVIVTR